MTKFIKELLSALKSVTLNLKLVHEAILRSNDLTDKMISGQAGIEKKLDELIKTEKEFILTQTQYIGQKLKMEFDEKRQRDLDRLEKKLSPSDLRY